MPPVSPVLRIHTKSYEAQQKRVPEHQSGPCSYVPHQDPPTTGPLSGGCRILTLPPWDLNASSFLLGLSLLSHV
jgi:hypothetical protein